MFSAVLGPLGRPMGLPTYPHRSAAPYYPTLARKIRNPARMFFILAFSQLHASRVLTILLIFAILLYYIVFKTKPECAEKFVTVSSSKIITVHSGETSTMYG
jgi:hypothetical protein